MANSPPLRVLITRTRHQASELAAALEAFGAETVLVPTIELAPPSSYCALDAALASLRSYDWLLFTSANAVQFFVQRARQQGIGLHPRRIAVIGPATARAVEARGLIPDTLPILVPQTYVAESLAEALLMERPSQTAANPAEGREAAPLQYLLVRAEEARDILPERLQAAGAHVAIAAAYRNLTPPDTVPALQRLFAAGATPPDVITFTSSSTARNLIALLEASGLSIPPDAALASIGPITSATLRELGHQPTFEAAEPTIASLATAIATHVLHRQRDL